MSGSGQRWPNLKIVACRPKSDIHRMSPWRPNWRQNRKSKDSEKCSQKEINGHQILTLGGPKPDVPEPPTDVRLLAGWSFWEPEYLRPCTSPRWCTTQQMRSARAQTMRIPLHWTGTTSSASVIRPVPALSEQLKPTASPQPIQLVPCFLTSICYIFFSNALHKWTFLRYSRLADCNM